MPGKISITFFVIFLPLFFIYSVDNFDNIAPEVEIKGEKKSIENILTGEEKQYYFINYSDNLSGIKTLKYVEEKISEDTNSDIQNLELIKEYMKNNGKNSMPDVDNLLTSFYQLDDEARQEVVETIRLKLQYHRDPKRAEQIKQIKGW